MRRLRHQGPCHGERVQYVLYGAYGLFCWQLIFGLAATHSSCPVVDLTVLRAICAPPTIFVLAGQVDGTVGNLRTPENCGAERYTTRAVHE